MPVSKKNYHKVDCASIVSGSKCPIKGRTRMRGALFRFQEVLETNGTEIEFSSHYFLVIMAN